MKDVEYYRQQRQQERPRRKSKAGYCWGAFAISLILIGGLCGFAAVDLSTDHYLPGQFPPIAQVLSWNREGLVFTAMGREYEIAGERADDINEMMMRLRGFLPVSTRWAALAASQGVSTLEEYREEEERRLEEAWELSPPGEG